MNIDCFAYEQIMIKLSYVQKGKGFPDIEVFEASKKAEENEWSIYGADDEESKKISFQSLDEIKVVELKDVVYEILFEKHEKEEYVYPKLTEVINVFNFRIRRKLNDKADLNKSN